MWINVYLKGVALHITTVKKTASHWSATLHLHGNQVVEER